MPAVVNATVIVLVCAQLIACERMPPRASCNQAKSIARPGDPGVVVNGATLMSAPERFAGEIVTISGYLGYLPGDGEQFALFFDEADMRYGWIAGSVVLKIAEQELAVARPSTGHRVTVEGIFDVLKPPVPSEAVPIGEVRSITQFHCVDERPFGSR